MIYKILLNEDLSKYYFEREVLIEGLMTRIKLVRYHEGCYYIIADTDAALYVYNPRNKSIQIINLAIEKLPKEIDEIIFFEVIGSRIRCILRLKKLKDPWDYRNKSHVEIRTFNFLIN